MIMLRFAYDRSPTVIQNLMIGTYGRYLKRLRFGGVYDEWLCALEKSQWQSADDIATMQEANLAAVLTHAYEQTHFYRSLFDARGVDPSRINLSNYADCVPVLKKESLRKSLESFRSRGFSSRQVVQINTSGTTGTPLAITATKSSVQRNYAFFSRFLRWAGVGVGQPGATFAGRVFIPRNQKRPPYWRKNAPSNTTLFSSYHISDETIPYYIQELERLAPTLIDAYPSAIYPIARYIVEKGIRHAIRPKAIVTSSETLGEIQRDTLETAFGCRIYDQYGSAEMVAFIAQCEHGRYHVNPEYGLVEVLGDEGKPVDLGVPGRLVCTGFLNLGMPLLRYEIGDSAVLSGSQCPCGRRFPVVESILGRTDDLIVTPEGRLVGRLDPIFKGLRGIKETQIVQETPRRVVVRVVRSDGYSRHISAALAAQLVARIGTGMDIRIEEVNDIPRTASGKFRSVVSHVSRTM